MIRFIPPLLALIAATPPATAQEAIPERMLKNLKDATLFIKVITGEGRLSTGSGFLMAREGETGLVVTNQHVIDTKGSSTRRIYVVFFSGTSSEKTIIAEPAGEDSSRDLAILKVKTKGLPLPLNLKSRIKLRETLPVYILGFPFGEALSRRPGNPTVTISKGSISSIRKDEYGLVSRVQIDGDLNPGNSGGPIVTSSGALVGVSVSTVMGTQIGFGIPPSELQEMLLGRVGGITLRRLEVKGGRAKMSVTMRLIDPLGKMKSTSMIYINKALLKKDPSPEADGFWKQAAPGMREIRLTIKGMEAQAEFYLSSSKKEEVVYLFQTKYRRGDSKTLYTQPGEFRVNFSSDMAAAGKEPPKPPKPEKDDWLGSEEDKKKAAAAAAGKPMETGTALKKETIEVVDAKVTPLDIEGRGRILSVLLSPDGKYLYLLETPGIVRKIVVESLVEERQFDTRNNCSMLRLSKEGLLVMANGIQELWILDLKTLDCRKKIAVAAVSGMGASPRLSEVFVNRNRNLAVVDLRKASIVKEYTTQNFRNARIRRHKDGVILSGFDHPTVTPDGKYLFCEGFECLHRFGISGTTLRYEEMGPRIGQNGRRIEVSSDSKYVCLPSGGGNYNVKDHPQIGSYGTYIYKVTDLLRPVISLSSGAYPTSMGFDKAARLLYTQNHSNQLITFSVTGVKQKEYSWKGGSTRQILVHPDGYKLFVLTESGIFWVELPK